MFEHDLSCSNTAVSEWKHPAKFSIWKSAVYKVIVSQKKESTLNHWNESFFKTNHKPFYFDAWNINILPVHLLHGKLDFRFGLNENANSFFATRCNFWSVKSSQTLL